jgi:hypothetical protein
VIKTPNIKLLKNEQYINQIDFWHSIIKIQYISNHLKPNNFKECKLGRSRINKSKSPIYSTVTIPSHVPVKDLSPPIYMMNYLTDSSVLRIIVIIYNVIYLLFLNGL